MSESEVSPGARSEATSAAGVSADRPGRRGFVLASVGGSAFLIAATTLISMGQGRYVQQLVNLALIYAVMVLGLNIMLGWAGLIDLSVPGFVGIGAYVTAIVTTRWAWPIWAAIGLSILLAIVLGLLFAVPTLRLQTHYFALATLGFAVIARLVFQNESQYTGGATGMHGVSRPTVLGSVLDADGMLWFILVALLLTIWLCRVVSLSQFGKRLLALKVDPLAAELVGVPTASTRLRAFAMASGLYALAGSLYALQFQFISPDIFNLQLTVVAYASLVVGGAGSIAGSVLGAAIVTFLPEWLRFLDRLYPTVYGMLILGFLLLMPSGLMPWVYRALQRVAGRLSNGRTEEVTPVAGSGEIPAEVPAGERRSEGRESRSVLRIEGLSISFGGIDALQGVSLDVKSGEIHALIGPNGAGKSTLVNCITGAYRPDAGSVSIHGLELVGRSPHAIVWSGVSRTFQNVRVFENLTVWDNLLVGVPATGMRGGVAEREAADWLLTFRLKHLAGRLASHLSFGEMRRLEIARALAVQPALLLLDEPASGLTADEVEELKAVLSQLSGAGLAVLLIEHDMRFVMGLSDRVTVLDFGRKIADGAPDEIRNDTRVIEAYLGKAGTSDA